MSLSDRIRPNHEAAPWVCEEVKRLEAELVTLRDENEALRRARDRQASLIRHHEETINLLEDEMIP